MYISRRRRQVAVPLPNGRRCDNGGRGRRRSMRVKAPIDIHGYLRKRRRAVHGGRRKVDTFETGLTILKRISN